MVEEETQKQAPPENKPEQPGPLEETKQELQETTKEVEADITEIDLLTMKCEEMPEAMQKLTKKIEILDSSIQKIKELQEVFPDKKSLKSLEKQAGKQHRKVEEKIAEITERYSACRPQ